MLLYLLYIFGNITNFTQVHKTIKHRVQSPPPPYDLHPGPNLVQSSSLSPSLLLCHYFTTPPSEPCIPLILLLCPLTHGANSDR